MYFRRFLLSAAIALGASAQLHAASQAITFVAVPTHVFGDVFSLNPTTDAVGLTPILSVVSGPATVAGNTVTTTGSGVVTLRATQPGNGTYDAAPPVTQTFAVTSAPAAISLSALAQPFDGRGKQAIATTLPALIPVVLTYDGGPTPPSLPGSYFVIATISETNYHGVASGTLIIGPGGQSIEFGPVPIPPHEFGDAPFTVTPTASSGLPVGLHVLAGPARLEGTTVTLIGAGTVVLQATQPGNARYAYATLTQSFDVARAVAPVVLGGLAAVFNGSTQAVSVSTIPAGLGVDVTYNGARTPPTAVGSYAVVATINDPNYAGLATGTLTIASGAATTLAAQAIRFGPAAAENRTFGDANFTVDATSSAGLPVTILVAEGPARMSGNSVILTGAGLVTLLASQAGNGAYAPSHVSQVFHVRKGKARLVVTDIVSAPNGGVQLVATTTPRGLGYSILTTEASRLRSSPGAM